MWEKLTMQWLRRNHGKEWNIRTLPEVRIKVSATRFRVADICLVSREGAPEPIVKRPPLAIIEVLSPEDRVSRYQQRLDDYRRMGVPNIWIVDPESRHGFDCSAGSWIETDSFAIEASPITDDLPTIFAAL